MLYHCSNCPARIVVPSKTKFESRVTNALLGTLALLSIAVASILIFKPDWFDPVKDALKQLKTKYEVKKK